MYTQYKPKDRCDFKARKPLSPCNDSQNSLRLQNQGNSLITLEHTAENKHQAAHSPSLYSPRKSKRPSVLSDDKHLIFLAPTQQQANARLPDFVNERIQKPRKILAKAQEEADSWYTLLQTAPGSLQLRGSGSIPFFAFGFTSADVNQSSLPALQNGSPTVPLTLANSNSLFPVLPLTSSHLFHTDHGQANQCC